MIDKIAMWGGFAGVIIAIIAVIILFLTRQNILDILDKDVILFDKNFELKKQAIEKAMLMIDELENNNGSSRSIDFVENAKKLYNELLCVVSDVRVADEFYALTMENKATPTSCAHFKLMCRHDIGLSNKKAKLAKRTKSESSEQNLKNTFAEDRPAIYNQMPRTQPNPINQPQQVKPVNTNAPTQRPQVQRTNAQRPVNTTTQTQRPLPRSGGDPSNPSF